MHFFNPAPIMKLVELVKAPRQVEQSMVDARAICAKLDKTPVKVKDSPGFIGNRVNRPFTWKPCGCWRQAKADIRGIDSAMRDVGGFKMGPFELLDLIGLDINLRVTETIYQDFGKPPRFAPNSIQQKLVQDRPPRPQEWSRFYHYANANYSRV